MIKRAFLSIQDAGTWFVARGATGPVWLKCPNGHLGTLNDHEVHPNGHVTPSVQCPTEKCTWHDDVILDDWAAAQRAATQGGT